MSRIVLTLATLLAMGACSRREERSEDRKSGHPDSSIAFHVGEAAHALAKESAKAAAVAEKKISKSANEAHEGWQHSAEKDRKKAAEK